MGVGQMVPQAVAPADDVGLPGREAAVHQPPHPQILLPGLQILEHGVLLAHHIPQEKLVAVTAALDGVVERHLALPLLPGPKVHQDLIRYPLLTDT